MYSAETISYFGFVCVLEGTSDSEQVDGVAGHGATQQPLAAELRLDRVVLDVVQVVLSTARRPQPCGVQEMCNAYAIG